jgi:phospholipid/cholesterol/gamma-HCH transport system substrate-binding protein
MSNFLARLMRPVTLIVVGVLLVGGVAGAVAFTSRDKGTYQVTAYFTKAIGLFENSDVDILGVPVGVVTHVEPVGTRVKVIMEINEEYRIEKSDETFAQIVPISVISDRYIQLGPTYDDGDDYLRDGDVLDEDITQIPAELDDVFKQLKKLLDAIEPGKEGEPGALGDLIVQLNRTLRDRERDLQGTLITGAELTGTLSEAEEDLDGLLVNLDGLFGKLSSRANSMSELNTNFARVMTALAQSRDDLEGTLTNLANLTTEVGDIATKHGDRLGEDLALASKITSAVLDNRASVEESLSWLPVVGRGVTAAYHPPPYSDIDVRDNASAKLECEFLDDLPPGPIKEQLRDICREQTGEPDNSPVPTAPITDERDPLLDCDKGVRRVKRQLRRIERMDLPQGAVDEILGPMRKQLKRLQKECKKLGEAIDDETLDDLLDDLPDVPGVDEVAPDLPGADLSGQAAGSTVFGTGEKSSWESFTGWLGGFVSFLGVGS